MRQRRDQERGFALLLIFALAATAAMMLYMELPRAVFESARAKEDLLVERGEQYKLAIRRFYAKTRKYPQNIEELEQTNGTRFLRKRYKDPMTGKDEWRFIHIGPAGFTDSKVQPAAQQTEQKEVRQSSISEGYQVGGSVPEQEEKGIQNVAMRQRTTDQLPAGGPGQGNETVPGDPTAPPPVPGAANSTNPATPGPPGFPGMPNAAGTPGAPGAQGTPGIATKGGALPFGAANNPGAQGQPGTGQPGTNPAVNMINNMLTTGRPQQTPTPSGSGAFNQQQQQPNAFNGGIAGVASKYKGVGIKLINERSKIEEWEFVYDYRQQTQNGTQNGQRPGNQNSQNPNSPFGPSGSSPGGSGFTPSPGSTMGGGSQFGGPGPRRTQ